MVQIADIKPVQEWQYQRGLVCRELPMEQRRLELVFAGKICRSGDRKHASALAAPEAGVWANAWGKASCREGSLGSV